MPAWVPAEKWLAAIAKIKELEKEIRKLKKIGSKPSKVSKKEAKK